MSAWCVSHWKPAKAAVWHWSHTENLSVLSIIIILFYNKDKTSWTLLPAPTGQSGCLMLVKQDIHSLHLPLSIPVQGICETSILQSFQHHPDIFEKDKMPRTYFETGLARAMVGQGEFSHAKIPTLLCLYSCCILSSSPSEKEHQNRHLIIAGHQRQADAPWVILTFQSDCSGALPFPCLSYRKGSQAMFRSLG